jgi:flagellar assembly factor FliW
MPFIKTRDFGDLPYDPDGEITFPQGIPGFHEQRRFVLIAPPAIAPLILLQSVEAASLCFLTVLVSVLDPQYQSGIAPEDLRILGLDGLDKNGLDEDRQPRAGEEALYLIILSAAGGLFFANLLAPIVINARTRVAVQAVRHDQLYSHRHPVAAKLLEPVCS